MKFNDRLERVTSPSFYIELFNPPPPPPLKEISPLLLKKSPRMETLGMDKPCLRVGVGTWAYQRVCSVRAVVLR